MNGSCCCQVADETEAVPKDTGASSFLAMPAGVPAGEVRLSWRALRAAGAGFWLTDAALLRCAE